MQRRTLMAASAAALAFPALAQPQSKTPLSNAALAPNPAEFRKAMAEPDAARTLDVLAALSDIRVPLYTVNARQVENNCAVVTLTIGINNTEHLNRVVARLSKVKDVLKVTRS